MSLMKGLATLLAVSWLAAGPALAGDAGVVLRATDLRAEPFRDAKTVGALERGEAVEILDRQGGWFRVKRATSAGWIRMLSVRRGEPRKGGDDVAGLLGLASGRAGTGQVVSATGIRGIREEELKAAKYDEAQVQKLETFTASRAAASEFAASGKLVARKVPYLPAPAPASGGSR
jgi:hypothetical protein